MKTKLVLLLLLVAMIACKNTTINPITNNTQDTTVNTIYYTQGTSIDSTSPCAIYSIKFDKSGKILIENNAMLLDGPDANMIAFLQILSGTYADSAKFFKAVQDGSNPTLITKIGAPREAQPALKANKLLYNYYYYDSLKAIWTADLYSVNLDGTGLTKIYTHVAFNTLPAISKDETKIAFESDEGYSIYLLVVCNIDGSNVKTYNINCTEINSMDWSPDGSKLLFTNDQNQISLFFQDGTTPKVMTTGTASNGGASWSPDGVKYAYCISYSQTNHSIAIMNADGTGFQEILKTGSQIPVNCQWSSDGTKILFSEFPWSTSPTFSGVLKVIDVNTKDVTVIDDLVYMGYWAK